VKTRFPLFARLLLWFFLNLLALVAGLLLMVRVQFGSLNNWLLPQSSQDQIQAMTATLVDNLVHSPRSTWGDTLSTLSEAYKMDFAIFDSRGQWMEGAKFEPPDDVRHAMIFARPKRPVPPPGGPGDFDPQPGQPPPPPGAGGDMPPPPEDGGDRPPPPRGRLPDFPKSVLHSGAAYWLLVRLPPEPLGAPLTLIGRTPKLGLSPLLFNPKPWIAVAAGLVVFSALFWLPMARNLTRARAGSTSSSPTAVATNSAASATPSTAWRAGSRNSSPARSVSSATRRTN